MKNAYFSMYIITGEKNKYSKWEWYMTSSAGGRLALDEVAGASDPSELLPLKFLVVIIKRLYKLMKIPQTCETYKLNP